jgi:spermidine synthase
VIQVTQRDQFSYAEMITHLPMFAHPNPEHVILIGGGDGAVLCEILKHKSVKSVTICEIDQMVIDVSKKHYPEYAHIWKHPKLKVMIGDGCAYLEAQKNKYDVVIVDSSDPVGPAEVLFQEKFFKSCKKALKKNGILCTQGECQWLHAKIIGEVTEFCGKLFKKVQYGFTTIPTYPSGQIGFVVCGKGDFSLKKPKRSVKKALKKKHQKSLKYYNTQIHKAAFAIPQFTKEQIHTK